MDKYEMCIVIKGSESEARETLERLQDFLDDCHIEYDEACIKEVSI